MGEKKEYKYRKVFSEKMKYFTICSIIAVICLGYLETARALKSSQGNNKENTLSSSNGAITSKGKKSKSKSRAKKSAKKSASQKDVLALLEEGQTISEKKEGKGMAPINPLTMAHKEDVVLELGDLNNIKDQKDLKMFEDSLRNSMMDIQAMAMSSVKSAETFEDASFLTEENKKHLKRITKVAEENNTAEGDEKEYVVSKMVISVSAEVYDPRTSKTVYTNAQMGAYTSQVGDEVVREVENGEGEVETVKDLNVKNTKIGFVQLN
ncbi:hypothetical protein NECID01_0784 [Nematocida sp. AWRm77]|nr:hypothetical protein NECID01_0784 [Nematocida sp. AWRm77]